MSNYLTQQRSNGSMESQCQYFVVRKKRLCRMTVRPGRQYCGEHEPQPTTTDGQSDTRIQCPNDPKHTVYVSKLEKHLTICNARLTEQPPFIVPNINAPSEVQACVRKPLSQLSKERIKQVIDKVNFLYEKHVKDNITTAPEHPIHSTVMEEFSENDRGESSLRHLRQVSSLLWLAEDEKLVSNDTCYVELGAGKGHMSYYACSAWCGERAGGGALLVDRAALRHKRDGRLRARGGRAWRLRADLAHLALEREPRAARAAALVGLAKHLCGVATDYALRCITADGILHKTRGIVVATCCHHRCEHAAFVANKHLQELTINDDDFNVMLGIVSWATCGDGRSRDTRRLSDEVRNQLSAEQSHELSDEARNQLSAEQSHELSDEARNQLSAEQSHELSDEARNQLSAEQSHELSDEARNQLSAEQSHELSDEARNQLSAEQSHELSDEARNQLSAEQSHELSDEARNQLSAEQSHELSDEARNQLSAEQSHELSDEARNQLSAEQSHELSDEARNQLSAEQSHELSEEARNQLSAEQSHELSDEARNQLSAEQSHELSDEARNQLSAEQSHELSEEARNQLSAEQSHELSDEARNQLSGLKQLVYDSTNQIHELSSSNHESDNMKESEHEETPVLTQEYREQVGRRAKQLLDWARVLYLRDKGFDARLCYFVPTSVSLENVCIVAKKLS